jgi:hypothetical protein
MHHAEGVCCGIRTPYHSRVRKRAIRNGNKMEFSLALYVFAVMFIGAVALTFYAVYNRAKAPRTDKHIMGGDVLSQFRDSGGGQGGSSNG